MDLSLGTKCFGALAWPYLDEAEWRLRDESNSLRTNACVAAEADDAANACFRSTNAHDAAEANDAANARNSSTNAHDAAQMLMIQHGHTNDAAPHIGPWIMLYYNAVMRQVFKRCASSTCGYLSFIRHLPSLTLSLQGLTQRPSILLCKRYVPSKKGTINCRR
eukprot:scaffold144173_cov17-Tisochrysis_lutea.AAC.1